MLDYLGSIDTCSEAKHHIRVTFQHGCATGHITYEESGNCRGLDVLKFNPELLTEADVDNFIENDCNFAVDEDTFCFFVLSKPTGNKVEFETTLEEVKDFITSLEIVNFKIV